MFVAGSTPSAKRIISRVSYHSTFLAYIHSGYSRLRHFSLARSSPNFPCGYTPAFSLCDISFLDIVIAKVHFIISSKLRYRINLFLSLSFSLARPFSLLSRLFPVVFHPRFRNTFLRADRISIAYLLLRSRPRIQLSPVSLYFRVSAFSSPANFRNSEGPLGLDRTRRYVFSFPCESRRSYVAGSK